MPCIFLLCNDFHSQMECISSSLQVIMKFKRDFWKTKMERADYFGLIPDSPEKRGFSYLFYDVSSKVTCRFLVDFAMLPDRAFAG